MLSCTQTKTAQPMGKYRATGLDASKASADFLITCVGKKTTLQWKTGSVEHVTDAKLAKLQAKYKWEANF